VSDMAGAAALLDGAGPDGAAALLAVEAALEATAEIPRAPGAGEIRDGSLRAEQPVDATAATEPPIPGAQALIELVQAPPGALALAAKLLADAWVVDRLEDLPRDFAGIAVTRGGRVWFAAWGEVRQVTEGGAERVLARRNERERLIADADAATAVEHAARATVQRALEEAQTADAARQQAEGALREAQRNHAEAVERERHAAWVIEQRSSAPEQGPLAVRRAQLEGELAAERRQAERLRRERAERLQRIERLRAQHAADTALAPLAERLATALQGAGEAVAARVSELQDELARDQAAGEEMAGELRACAAQEAEIQARLRAAGETVTAAEVSAQRLRDQTAEAELELSTVVERLGHPAPVAAEAEGEPAQDARDLDVPEDATRMDVAQGTPRESARETDRSEGDQLSEEEVRALTARVERLRRRREQLGPVNPLAQEEYAQALAHVEELEARRADLETGLRELRTVIRDTDRQIHETFQATFQAAARNFEELVGDVFPGGSGRLRLVKDEHVPRPVLGGQPAPGDGAPAGEGAQDADAEAAAEAEAGRELQRDGEAELMGVEIEITPAGKSTKRLSLLSGGEKSMTALAFLFAVFLARPCPFYILDEVEAALDDLNLDRFLALLRRYADRAQFIVITHQKRTMEAADWLYGVSMAGNGVSKVLSRRLPPAEQTPGQAAESAPPAPQTLAPADEPTPTGELAPAESPQPKMAEVA
jgi:chromosome segregation protein